MNEYHSNREGTNCGKYRTNADLGKTLSVTKKRLNPTDNAIPCGIGA